MKVNTNIKGQLAEAKAYLRAAELGYITCKPSFNTRYDMVLDDGKKLLRVQVKYGDAKYSNSTGSIWVKLCYEDRRKNVYTYQIHEVDGLIVYIPKIDKLCYFPPNIFCGKVKLSIRYQRAKSNVTMGIIFAEDFFW